jgi:CDGSH iron-sulfur domain-containing protein 3
MCEPIIIQATKNGPLRVEGDLELLDAEGNVLETGETTYLCRCGGSKHKPFCDSTHRKNNFQG